jgi:hypothetical protein
MFIYRSLHSLPFPARQQVSRLAFRRHVNRISAKILTVLNNFHRFTQSRPICWDLWFLLGKSAVQTLIWRLGVLAEVLRGFSFLSGKLWQTALKGHGRLLSRYFKTIFQSHPFIYAM